MFFFFFFQAEDGIRDGHVTGVQTCALPILNRTATRLAQRAAVRFRAPALELVLQALSTRPATREELDHIRALLRERSEERRVGKEGRWWWWAGECKVNGV